MKNNPRKTIFSMVEMFEGMLKCMHNNSPGIRQIVIKFWTSLKNIFPLKQNIL